MKEKEGEMKIIRQYWEHAKRRKKVDNERKIKEEKEKRKKIELEQERKVCQMRMIREIQEKIDRQKKEVLHFLTINYYLQETLYKRNIEFHSKSKAEYQRKREEYQNWWSELQNKQEQKVIPQNIYYPLASRIGTEDNEEKKSKKTKTGEISEDNTRETKVSNGKTSCRFGSC